MHDFPPFEYVGITVIVAVTGAVPEFFATKEAILPDPFAANPIEELVLTQA